jgi:uncharacterized protein
MILKSTLSHVLEAQKENLKKLDPGLTRETLPALPNLASHALIVSGIRRCGKSTLLYQLLADKHPHATYLNFEDTRLYDFESTDFNRLDDLITESQSSVLFFDEIQIINHWERYARQKLDEGFKMVITGSNASLLSKELGTKLTGRHITKELFPFSFIEFSSFKHLEPTEASVASYLEIGGFPEYVKSETEEILHHLFEDILIRDIAVRYGVRDVKTLRRLALYLISNVGKLVTGNRLKTLFEIGSTSTVMDYLSHLESAYLFYFVPKFSYSLRKQLVNPRKLYAIDTGMIKVNSGSFTDDQGRKFENMIFLHLRRQFKEIYYFSETRECDFVIFDKGVARQVVQVCYELNPDNMDRELNGLYDAMSHFNFAEGVIVTMTQKDRFERNGKVALAIPAHDFLI